MVDCEMKDIMSSVDIAVLTLELADRIVKQRIDNIYHILPKTFIIRLRPSGLRLLIEIERRMHLTQFNYPTPQKPSNFCMGLRKKLVGGVLESVEQYEFERIVNLKISTSDGAFTLVAELFRRGNLIIVDPENKVHSSLRYARMRDRNVIRREPYQPAPLSGLNPLSADIDRLQAMKELGDVTVLKALTSLLSTGPLYCREILLRSGIDTETPAKGLVETQFQAILDSISELKIRIIKRRIDPVIVFDEAGAFLDVTPFPLKVYEGKPAKRFETYNEAADEYYSAQAATHLIERAKESQAQEEARLQRILREQSEQRELLKKTVISSREVGDQIYLNLHTLTEIAEALRREKEKGASPQDLEQLAKQRMANVKPEVKVESLPEGLNFDISGKVVHIRHDKSPQQVAQEYYAAAKKAAQKLQGLEESLKETEVKLRNLPTKAADETAEFKIPRRMREKAWYEKFHWFRSSDDFLVVSGKDASTNDLLIKRHLEIPDIVFHAEVHGAPFTVIKTDGRKVSETTLLEAAQAAASRSKAWSLGLASLDVYWVNTEQVSMKAPSGEYMGKGQFMITGKRNYVRGVELKVAIGIQRGNDEVRFIAGPPAAIKKQAEAYVELVPGKVSSGKLAKKIIEVLKSTSPEQLREKISQALLDEVARLVPAGRGEIISKGRATQTL